MRRRTERKPTAREFGSTYSSHRHGVADRQTLLVNWRRIAAYHRENGNTHGEREALAHIAKLGCTTHDFECEVVELGGAT